MREVCAGAASAPSIGNSLGRLVAAVGPRSRMFAEEGTLRLDRIGFSRGGE
jgi:hypothetical protein